VPFPTGATRPRPFTRPDGSIVEVDTMSVDLPAAVLVQGQGWEAVRLPYAGAQLAMTIVVPDVGGLPALEASLDGPWVGRLLAQTPLGAPLTVRLPRWTFRTAVSLNAVLAQMGMPSAFSESAADFSAMTGERDLVISEVAHQAFVAVDEEGTEAAAATAVVAEAEAVSAPAIPERVLAVDRPFLFVIHDVHTAAPLFLGRVEHPNAT